MRISRTINLTILTFSLLSYLNGFSSNPVPQDQQKKGGTEQKPAQTIKKTGPSTGGPRVISIKPVKKDTLSKEQSTLKKFSESELTSQSGAKKITDPNEKKAEELFISGSKKGKEGDYKGAIEDLTKSLSFHKNGNTYMKRGFTFILMENYPLALQDLNEAIKMLPVYAKAYFSRGVCFYEMKNYKAAEDDLDKCLEIERTNPLAFNYMAALKFLKNDYKGALENYDEVIRLDQKNKDAYNNRGMMRHYLHDFKGAIQDFDKTLKLDPNDPTAYNNRGAAKFTLEDFKGAYDDFTAALKIKDDYADAYDMRGKARFKLGDTKGACDDWQKAYSLGEQTSMDLILKFCK